MALLKKQKPPKYWEALLVILSGLKDLNLRPSRLKSARSNRSVIFFYYL